MGIASRLFFARDSRKDLRRATLLLVLALASAGAVCAQDVDLSTEGTYFVYLGSFSTKAAAQNHALEFGGWVLRTDLYTALTPGFFAAVVGPFRARSDAENALADLQPLQPDAQVRVGGASMLSPSLGDPGLLAAVLGELKVVVNTDTLSTNPCAPNEPHTTIVVGFAAPVLGDEDAPLGGFWVVDRTGEIIPIRRCEE